MAASRPSSPSLPILLAVLSLSLILARPALSRRVISSPLSISYHNGPLLSGTQPLTLHLTFYGDFRPSERAAVKSFLASLSPVADHDEGATASSSLRSSLRFTAIQLPSSPTVAQWWSIIRAYTDKLGRGVSGNIVVGGETLDSYSLGKQLKESDIASLAKASVRKFPTRAARNSISLVFTAADVSVDGFCMHSCGGHGHASLALSLPTPADAAGENADSIAYAWVGNARLQCPGFCSWPFAKPVYGPPMEPLVAPNGVAEDGMVMNLAKILVAVATNPYGNAYYEGNGQYVLHEAAGVCTGVFGRNAYPGFPGELRTDPSNGASYNMEGAGGIRFLVPWIWNPKTMSCAGLP